MKIKFKQSRSNFFEELSTQVSSVMTQKVIAKSTRLLKIKFFFYVVMFFGCYGLLFGDELSSSFIWRTIIYVLLGFSGILLSFNAAHDAVHNTLFDKKKYNAIAHYLIFNLQGVNSTLWKKRHISSHHLFPNVDGCDADIDHNPFIRLSSLHKRKWSHRIQHFYAPIVYCLYTLHWILIKDFIYLSKKEVANMKNLTYSRGFVLEVILLKLTYFAITLLIPWYFSQVGFLQFLVSFLIMHGCISIFFVLTLIISHLTIETTFPSADEDGFLPTCYHEHQLAVSMDYHPTSRLANWIFGGFNSHAAHHLFPRLPHTVYTRVTPLIQKVAEKYDMPYNQKSMLGAIRSHFLYLKKLGRN